jgi:hemolysin III
MDETLLSGSVDVLLGREATAVSKPILRGWSHLGAAVGAAVFIRVLSQQSQIAGPHVVSIVIFALGTLNLYAVSAIYHIGVWRPSTRRRLRALDRANIFVLIAATYTPFCANVLSGWLRPATLVTVWGLAAAGIAYAPFADRSPRWVVVAVYVGMGWICLPMLPAFMAVLPRQAFALALLGGSIYIGGGLIYARQRPDPFPRVFGYHELFHLCVIAGGVIFAVIIWTWTLPFPHS